MGEDANRVVGKYICSRYHCSKVSEVLTEMGGMCLEHSSPLLFEIQRPYDLRNIADRVPFFVPWEFVKPHERAAQGNHGGQTLARLSERGGLSLKETLAVVTGRDWTHVERLTREKAADELLALLTSWQQAQRAGVDGAHG